MKIGAMMHKIILVVVVISLSSCGSYVPPESVSPIAEICAKFEMKVRVMDSYILCWKDKK